MNTRGLVELVVLNVGLDLGVITPALFTMLVLMALVTTAAAAPLVRLCSGRAFAPAVAAAFDPAPGVPPSLVRRPRGWRPGRPDGTAPARGSLRLVPDNEQERPSCG